ncbi:MAG TPA: class I SAM-dependent methyltransferase [Pyrinomonadaceae bacterium]|nr:class I SAM-dependent methyltransferase [Pyrinomonadaceae bacterium]
MPKMQDQWEVFDLVEAFLLSQAVAALHQLALLTALETPRGASELAARFKLDENLLSGTLEYVCSRTSLLRKAPGGRFVVTRNYTVAARFFLDLYLGAYGGNATQLEKILRQPKLASKSVDRKRHARAFSHAGSASLGPLPDIIRQLKFTNLLDLGCGNGELLLELASQDGEFEGWGVDTNPAMLQVARARARTARRQDRVRFVEGDCLRPGAAIPKQIRSRIGSVTACHVANEMFRDGPQRAVRWLIDLRKNFPARPLLISDYYGRLGQKKSGRVEKERETLLHDFAQLISGQGIPPASARDWRSIYSQARCQLVHIIEDKATTRFIHILRL